MDPAKVSAGADWPMPTNRKQWQHCNGFANFCRRFVRNYSSVAAPRKALTSSSVPFRWTPEAEAAFWEPPQTPVHHLPFYLICFAGSGPGLGGMATLVGGHYAFLHCLAYIQSTKRLNSRQVRWLLFLGRFYFTITYRPGSRNTKLDTLSHQFSVGEESVQPEPIVPFSWVITSFTWDIETAVCQAQLQALVPDSGPPGHGLQHLAVRSQVLQWAHASRIACNPGIRCTISSHLLRPRFWWPDLNSDAHSYVTACSICTRNESSTKPSSGLLHPLPTPS